MRRLLLLPALLLFTACPPRLDFGTYGLLEDPALILDTVARRRSRIASLSGEAKLTVESPEGSGSLQAAVVVQEPGSVYLETADFLGTPRGTFVTDGNAFAFYQPAENKLLVGPATAARMKRYLPVALGPTELVAALLGEVPLLGAAGARLALDDEAGAYVLQLSEGAVSQRVLIGTKDLRLLSVETRGADRYDVFFEDHEELVPGIPFAKKLRLVAPGGRTQVQIRYKEITLNAVTRPEDFRLVAPPGTTVEPG